MGAAQSTEQIDKLHLRVMVDKERNKVVYAEAGKDFVDALFSFLTLPLGTIARLIAKDSNIEAVRFGSISSLYQSVSDLDQQYLCSNTCKEMLLKPRNSMEGYCQKMKLNIDDTEPMQHFICEKWDCVRKKSDLSLFRNQKCSCGKIMNRLLPTPPDRLSLGNGFVNESATFIISDDLSVMPNVLGTVVQLLQKLEVTNIEETIVEQTVEICKKEIIDILKLSLVSKTPLTDFILKKKYFPLKFKKRNVPQFNFGEVTSEEGRQMSLKVTVRKSTMDILFAEAEEDFVDFVFSFLTFPLGGVLHMLQGVSSVSCIDNLYNSMTELSPDRYLMSQGLADLLRNPPISAQFGLCNQILPIAEASLPVYFCHTYSFLSQYFGTLLSTYYYDGWYHMEKCVPLNLVEPKYSASKSSNCGEFVKGPSIYMVTNDLVVTPMTSSTAISYLNSSNLPLFDVEERVVRIGMEEGLSILKASLTSRSALTNGLNQVLARTIKEEKKMSAMKSFQRYFQSKESLFHCIAIVWILFLVSCTSIRFQFTLIHCCKLDFGKQEMLFVLVGIIISNLIKLLWSFKGLCLQL